MGSALLRASEDLAWVLPVAFPPTPHVEPPIPRSSWSYGIPLALTEVACVIVLVAEWENHSEAVNMVWMAMALAPAGALLRCASCGGSPLCIHSPNIAKRAGTT